MPGRVALGLAALVVIVGVWAGTRQDGPAQGDERKRLIARRDKLFQELVRLEQDQRRGKGNPARREELLSQLELVYGALDTDDAAPGVRGRPGSKARVGGGSDSPRTQSTDAGLRAS